MLHMYSFIHNYYFWQYTGIALDNKKHLNKKNYDISIFMHCYSRAYWMHLCQLLSN